MNEFQKAMAEWGVSQAPIILEAVTREAPAGKYPRQLDLFGSGSTTLQNSLKKRVTGRVDNTRIEIRSSVRYSVIVEKGHAIITPVSAQILHFIGMDGEDVFVPMVAATDPNPYPQRGWGKVRSIVRGDLEHRMTMAGVSQLRKSIKLGGLI